MTELIAKSNYLETDAKVITLKAFMKSVGTPISIEFKFTNPDGYRCPLAWGNLIWDDTCLANGDEIRLCFPNKYPQLTVEAWSTGHDKENYFVVEGLEIKAGGDDASES